MKLTRRKALASGFGAAMALPAQRLLAQRARQVVVATTGGQFSQHMRHVFWEPFTAETGIRIVEGNYTLAKHMAMKEAGRTEWDLGHPGLPQLGELMTRNAVERIDYGVVDRRQFPGAASDEYYIGFQYFSTNIVINTKRFPATGPRPAGWADFWNVSKFPGPRSMRKQPFLTLEAALIADGVPMDKLYPLDLDRAFKKLDQLKPHISVWWTTGAQSVDVIASGEVDMGVAWDSRVSAGRSAGQPVETIWNEGAMLPSIHVVMAGAPNRPDTMKYLNYLGRADRQAEMAKLNGSAPSNPAALSLIEPSLALTLCSHPDNVKQMFWFDAVAQSYWRERLSSISERFNVWIARG
ncbi:MAG: ABC transporter substrate-binding protein [Rhizobiales bacterium]|nr:ABC transporter substrate-binding protein [Hyphomicrobiales bacterium]